MPDRMLREAARFSDRVQSVSKDAELMWWRMLTAPDDYGIYYADADQLRSAVWPKNRRGVRIADVARWRDELTQAGMLAQFEVEGVRHIELLRFRQAERLKHPRRRFPARPREPDDPAQMKMALPPPDPNPKGSEEKGEGTRRARRDATPAPGAAARETFKPQAGEETQDAWLARLAREYPHADIAAELTAAAKNRRLQNKRLERDWFEKYWLKNLSPVVDFATSSATGAGSAIEPEPEAWRLFLKDSYEHESWASSAASCMWATMPANWRAKITREMAAHA